MTLDLNPEFQQALELMETTQLNLFITGRAGTGKSTLLNYFREKTPKNIAVLAPTGVAALNVQGQTIHSFFKFKPTVTLDSIRRLSKEKERDIYGNLDAIVIDEISMVRADLLDCVDRFLRLNGKTPHELFGGVQMIFIGDLYQLPPVVTSEEKEALDWLNIHDLCRCGHEKAAHSKFIGGKFVGCQSCECKEFRSYYGERHE